MGSDAGAQPGNATLLYEGVARGRLPTIFFSRSPHISSFILFQTYFTLYIAIKNKILPKNTKPSIIIPFLLMKIMLLIHL